MSRKKKTGTDESADVRTVEFARELECVLSVEDLAKAADELARLGDEIVDEEQHIKERVKELKEALKDLKISEKDLRHKVRRKSEPRLVKCVRTFDYVRGVILETRLDTGEQIGSSVMADEQRELPEVIEPEPVRAEFSDGSKLLLLPAVSQSHGDDLADPAKPLVDVGTVEIELDAETRRDALKVLHETQRASTSSIQRRMRVGFMKAALILDALEREGIVGPQNGAEPREILVEVGDLLEREESAKAGE